MSHAHCGRCGFEPCECQKLHCKGCGAWDTIEEQYSQLSRKYDEQRDEIERLRAEAEHYLSIIKNTDAYAERLRDNLHWYKQTVECTKEIERLEELTDRQAKHIVDVAHENGKLRAALEHPTIDHQPVWDVISAIGGPRQRCRVCGRLGLPLPADETSEAAYYKCKHGTTMRQGLVHEDECEDCAKEASEKT
jgi:cell division septum initiation protein DivIVA